MKGKDMKHLFEAHLQYKPEASPVTSSEGRIGKRLGSGDGKVKGLRIQGALRWDIYEKSGVVTGENRCQTNITGVIETHDGAQIQLDSTGFGMVPDSSQPNKWRMAAALNFNSSDERYAWLNTILGVWSGEFDMNTGQHRYQAYFHAIET